MPRPPKALAGNLNVHFHLGMLTIVAEHLLTSSHGILGSLQGSFSVFHRQMGLAVNGVCINPCTPFPDLTSECSHAMFPVLSLCSLLSGVERIPLRTSGFRGET